LRPRFLLAATAHGEHEKRNGGKYDVSWPDWYTEYIVNEQAGKPLVPPHVVDINCGSPRLANRRFARTRPRSNCEM
jgi:hypothetical protein